jgi:hypothetical protein
MNQYFVWAVLKGVNASCVLEEVVYAVRCLALRRISLNILPSSVEQMVESDGEDASLQPNFVL